MRTTLIVIAGTTALLASLYPDNASPSRTSSLVTANPCGHGREGQEQPLQDNARAFASDGDSAYVERRAEMGLLLWPLDSVQLTQDSTVCAHLDSLIAVWQAGPEAQSKNALRFAGWPGITVARINPHKYMALPPFRDNQGAGWYFIVDSVGGTVRFLRVYDQ